MSSLRLMSGVRTPMLVLIALWLIACGDSEQRSISDPIRSRDAATPDTSDDERDASAPDEDHEPDPDTFERLLVADGVTPMVYLVDAASHETLASFGLAAVARVYRGALGRYGFAVQGEGNRVQIFDSGLVVEDHGDHVHHERGVPGLLTLALSGTRPVHFVPHDRHAAAFFDDDGVAHLLDETSLALASPNVLRIDTGMPHHGVALSFGNGFLASTPELIPPAERASPTGIAAYDATGKATGERFGECPSLHGEAALDEVAAFGCSDGVLLVEAGKTLTARKLANPGVGGSPAPRVGTLAAHPDAPHIIGNFGGERLCIVDLTAGALRPVQVPAPYLQFGFDAHGEHILLLAKTGRLHILDANDLSEVTALDVTHAATDDSGHGARYPQFAVGAHAVYVTDPQDGKVVVVDLVQNAIVAEIPVPGTPTKIAVLGPSEAH